MKSELYERGYGRIFFCFLFFFNLQKQANYGAVYCIVHTENGSGVSVADMQCTLQLQRRKCATPVVRVRTVKWDGFNAEANFHSTTA